MVRARWDTQIQFQSNALLGLAKKRYMSGSALSENVGFPSAGGGQKTQFSARVDIIPGPLFTHFSI